MKPADLRLEILKLCESFAAAAQTGNQIVIAATAEVVKAQVAQLIPDQIEQPEETESTQ
jgi:hypothetical protein